MSSLQVIAKSADAARRREILSEMEAILLQAARTLT